MSAKPDARARTSSERQDAHLKRLQVSEGKRKVIDLDSERVVKLAELKLAGYGASDSDVVRRALDEAHARLKKR